MVGAKLHPIAVRRRVPGFDNLPFRSLILAAACLAASRGLNHRAAAAAAAAAASPSGGCLECSHHRIHFLGKRNMAGRDNETPMHLLGANAAESQRCPGAALTRGGASSATGSDAPHDPMATSDGGGGVRGGTPESSINGEGAKRARQSPLTGAEHASGSGVSSEREAEAGVVGDKGASTSAMATVAVRAATGGVVSATSKREGYLVWDDYFMSVAFLSAMRSKDPSTQVGACIVNQDKRIVGIGYNGFPMGCSDDELPWAREAEHELDTKYPYVCHAEMNAILNKNSADVKGCSIYVALFPCNECAKLIIQSGIREVVYLSDKYRDTTSMKASRRLFGLAGVHCRQHVPKGDRIVIDFKSALR